MTTTKQQPRSIVDEEWNRIPGYPKYMISNMGRLMSFHRDPAGRLMATEPSVDNGYVYVTLIEGKRLYSATMHKLVGQTFHRPLKKGEVYHHKDTVRHHNQVDNIEITTRINNVLIAMNSGNNKAPHSKIGKTKRFTPAEVEKIRAEYKAGGISMKHLAEKYDRNMTSVCDILHEKSYTSRRQGKFSGAEVKDIRELLLKGHSEEELAKRFDTSLYVIRGIHLYRTYKNI